MSELKIIDNIWWYSMRVFWLTYERFSRGWYIYIYIYIYTHIYIYIYIYIYICFWYWTVREWRTPRSFDNLYTQFSIFSQLLRCTFFKIKLLWLLLSTHIFYQISTHVSQSVKRLCLFLPQQYLSDDTPHTHQMICLYVFVCVGVSESLCIHLYCWVCKSFDNGCLQLGWPSYVLNIITTVSL